MPIAAFATIENDQLFLRALVGGTDNQLISAQSQGIVDKALTIGKNVAQQLLEQGAQTLIQQIAEAEAQS